jgi:predicted permease
MFRFPSRRRRRLRERDEEMRAHVEMYVDELVARGRSPEDAAREARVQFGNPRVKLEEIDEMRRVPVADALLRDLRYAVRVLRRTPAFTLTAVITLALVVGANTAVFSLVDAVLFRPPPYPDPERLAFVVAHVRGERGEDEQLAQDAATWEAVRDHVPSLDAAVYSDIVDGVNLVVGGRAAFVDQQRVSTGYFRVLGVLPAVGREFAAVEDRPDGPAVAVLSHTVWQRHFDRDPGIVGRAIRLRGEPYQVIGVMPEGFGGAEEADIWTPLRASRRGEGGGANFLVVARLREGATWTQADEELRRVSGEALAVRGVRAEEGLTGALFARRMQDVRAGANREPLVMLGAATMAVLLIACVNIAGLMLARGVSRSKEMATRMALGGGRLAVIRQVMVESLVIGLAGGAAGLLVARLGLTGLQYLGASTFQVWEQASLDGRVLVVTAVLVVGTSLLFGLVPALQASRLSPHSALSEGGSRSVAGAARRWPGRILVISEVALGVALLVVTGLLVRTFVNLHRLDAGFDPADLVTASVSLQDARYSTSDAVSQLVEGSLRELRSMPDVEHAAVSLRLPYTRLLNWGFRFAEAPADQGAMINASYVSDGFFETFRIPMVAGRPIDAADRATSRPVVVVNRGFVRAFSPDRPAIGRRISMSGAEREIVGVVGDVQQADSGIRFEGRVDGPIMTTPTVYLPVAQAPAAFLNAVHTWFRPYWTTRPKARGQAAGAVAQAIARVDPLLPVAAEETVAAAMVRATARERLMMMLVGVLAAVALLLSALGIHGLIGHAVASRARELAIRMALGASVAGTMARVAGSGLILAAAGAALGGVLSLWGVGLVDSFLWSVGPRDPLTYAGVAAFFMLVATVASILPALRILRLDPAETLR